MVRGFAAQPPRGRHRQALRLPYSNNKGAREGMARVDRKCRRAKWKHNIYPFKRVIREAGMLGVMSSYNDYDGIPAQVATIGSPTRSRWRNGDSVATSYPTVTP